MKNIFKNKIVLAIGAHPDDIEFGCGATMAKLSSQGAKLYFVVCTDGNRGSRQTKIEKLELIKNRREEQLNAAKILGALEVFFLEEEDGNLIADINFKEKIVRMIRKLKPDMIFTHDPSWFYRINQTNGKAWVNHTDHRSCGEAVLDAVYPLARDLQSFPDHVQEGLDPHIVPEAYLFNFSDPKFFFDVTGFENQKINSILAHKSQIDNPNGLSKNMLDHLKKLGKKPKVKSAEGFTRLIFN